MDKSTNVHLKVAATFVSTYYNALADGKIADIMKMYRPNATVKHWSSEGAAQSLAAYAKGARVVITEMDPTLANNTHLKIAVKGSMTVEGDEKKDFQHDIELEHHNTTSSQLAFGITTDFLRAHRSLPPPPKMKFDDWAADTPQLSAQHENESVPAIDLVKEATPQVTPKVVPAPAPATVATPVAAPVAAPAVEEKVVEKVEEKAPEAPKGWASIVRSDKTGPKTVVSVVDPTKKVPVVEKKEVVEEKKVEKKEKKEEEAPKEKRSPKNPTPIFYDIFVKGFPESITEADVPAALGLKVAVANIKKDSKEDKSGIRRVFVYIKFSEEDLVKQGKSRADAIAEIVAANKNTKYNTNRLSVEEVKERYNSDGSVAKNKK